MKYSISYKDAAGITTRSECLQFDADEDASAFAKQDLSKNALIEVWKDDHLVVRLEPTAKGARV
jgi:hypothetical protein